MNKREYSKLVRRHPGTDYATVVRGLAALAVMGVHASAVYPLSQFSESVGFGDSLVINLGNLGAAGPAAFFITSGFVLSIVWERQKKYGFKRWLIRRYLRLTPLYFIALGYCLITNPSFTFSDLVLRLLYLDAFHQPLFLRDPLGILWTISIEFWLSLCIPVLVFLFRSVKYPEVTLLTTFVITLVSPTILIELGLGESMAQKSLPSALFCFAVGSYLSTFGESAESTKVFGLFLVFSLGFTLMYLWGGYMGAWWVTILLTTAYLGYKRTQVSKFSPPNPLLIWLGTICYGVYLLHILVIENLGSWSANWGFYLSLPPVLILASLSWVLIEDPIGGLFRPRAQK